MVGPVRLDQDLRTLPYVAPKKEFEEKTSDALSPLGYWTESAPSGYSLSGLKYVQALLKNLWRPTPTIPGPLFTFEGISQTPAVVNRVTARGMSARIITLKRSMKTSRSMTKAVIPCRARPVIIHSFQV